MKFSEALEALNQGKYVTREFWNETGDYLVLLRGMQNIWKIVVSPSPNAGMYNPLVVDLNADDWIEYERIRETGVTAIVEEQAAA